MQVGLLPGHATQVCSQAHIDRVDLLQTVKTALQHSQPAPFRQWQYSYTAAWELWVH